MAYKIVNDDSLTSVANAIRVKGSISGTLEFPDGFVSAIQNLSPSSNVFLVSLSWDSQDEIWVPDRTWAEVEAAYNAGKVLLLNDFYDEGNIEYYGNLYVDSDNPLVIIASVAYWDWDNDRLMSDEYFWDDDDGWRLDYRHQIITPNFESITRTYTPTSSTQTETITYNPSDYNGIDHVSVTVNPIPSQYIVPSGTKTITENGTYDVTNFASADVNVSSGVDIPVFRATWTPDGTPSGAITCNKTYNQCYNLVQRDHMFAGIIMNSHTYLSDPSTYSLSGTYEYIDGQWCILYYNDGDYSRSIKYASDGTISVFDATDY